MYYASVLLLRCVACRVCKGVLILPPFSNNIPDALFSSSWRHWGCVTPKIFENVKKSITEASELDGYEALQPEDQAKIVKAWQEGHVDDEDIPETARKPAGDEDGSEEKPKKAAKRAPAKKKAAAAAGSEGEAEERPKRKAKTAAAAKVRSLLFKMVIAFNCGICLFTED